MLVAGGVLWEPGSAHRAPPPPRHPLRLQRMAPRPRPPRHYATHPHPNMVPIPQAASMPAGNGAPSKPPQLGYKPRLHIPLLSSLGRGPLSRPHHHHHHHHPGPHHHHHPGHHHHHHHPHHHHGHHHHGPHHHHHHGRHTGQQQQQQQQQQHAGAQLPRLQVHNSPGVMHVHGKPTGFGFPGEHAPAGHTGPGALPVRQIRPAFGPPPQHRPHFFQQDPENPFANNEPVSELPTSTGAYHHPSGQPLLPQTTAAYGDTSGFTGSTYKGWKPIAKPFQSSYPRGNPAQGQSAGLSNFPRGPPHDYPQLSDNHLHGFPEFDGGPTGPPGGSTEYTGGPPEHILGFPNIPDPPQVPNFSRPPPTQATGALGGGSSGSAEGSFLDFQHGPPMYRPPPHGGPHSSPAPPPPRDHFPGKPMYLPIPSSSPFSHQDFSGPPQHSSTTPRNHYPPQFHPSGGGAPPPSGFNNFNNLNTNTLFRENIMQHLQPNRPDNHGNHLGGGGHQPPHPSQFPQQAPLGSQEVVVPLPPEIGDGVRLPNSLFTDNSWSQNSGGQPFEASQSEENVVIKKPKFGGKQKLGPGGPTLHAPGHGGSDESSESGGPSILPKFKATRFNRLNTIKNNNLNNPFDNEKGHSGFLGDNDAEHDGPEKLASPSSSDEGLGDPHGGNQKNKNNRGRVRIRTRLRRPNPFRSGSGEDGHNDSNHGGPSDGPGSSSKPFPPFPGAKPESSPISHQRGRPIFRKQPPIIPPPHDSSTEPPNSLESPGPGPAPGLGGSLSGHPGGDIPKGPISEELSNFPTLPFPPPDPDFIRDFPTPNIPRPEPPHLPPPPPPSTTPTKLREVPPRIPFGRPPGTIRGQLAGVSNSLENSGHGASDGSSHRDQPFPVRPHLRRRRPKTTQKPHQEDHQHHTAVVTHSDQDNKHRNPPPLLPSASPAQKGNVRIRGEKNEIHDDHTHNPGPPPSLGLDSNNPLFSDEFFFPPGFNPDPSKVTGDNPVSFITMPNAKPQVIHHDIIQPTSHEAHQNPPQQSHRPNFQHSPPFRGPTTQHFPPLQDFGDHLNHNNHNQFPRHHQPPPQQHAPPPPSHHHPPPPPPGHQLSSYSDHLPFSRVPLPRRKPARANPPPSVKPHGPQQMHAPQLNPYAFPTSNPYAIPTGPGQYVQGPTGPHGQPHLTSPQSFEVDNAPQTSNSYEMPEAPMFGGKLIRQQVPQQGPVYHGPSNPPPSPPAPHPTPVGIPIPTGHPPPRHIPVIHGPHHGRGRIPGGGRGPPPHHMRGRRPQPPPLAMAPAPVDPVGMGQSAEFEQIPAQYVDANSLPSSSPAAPTVASAPKARPVFSKPHVHHSPDIHPPGTFFDDFFKPFDDAFGQGQPAAPATTSRADAMETHDEQQSQSNVQLNVVPSPANKTEESTPPTKPWSKLKPGKQDKNVEPTSSEKPQRGGKKPINGRLGPNGQEKNGKHHLKAKIADIARKNFQTHMAAASGDDEVPAVTTYKPVLIKTNNSSPGDSIEIPVIKTLPSWTEDDSEDSNIPAKTIRFSSKTESGPMLIHHRGKDNDHPHHPQDGTTILFKSKRQFRRKRPDKGDGDKEETSPRIAQHLRSEKEDNNDSLDDLPREGETTRVGVIRRRKLFPRRRNFSLSTKIPKGSKDIAEVTESGMGMAEPVTYGESQWFRVRKHDEEYPGVDHKSGKEELSSPVPTPESKTVPAEGSPHSSNSNNVSNKNSRKSESSSVVSSSSSSSTSTSSSSTSKDDRPFAKKSSKFLMNRMSIAAA